MNEWSDLIESSRCGGEERRSLLQEEEKSVETRGEEKRSEEGVLVDTRREEKRRDVRRAAIEQRKWSSENRSATGEYESLQYSTVQYTDGTRTSTTRTLQHRSWRTVVCYRQPNRTESNRTKRRARRCRRDGLSCLRSECRRTQRAPLRTLHSTQNTSIIADVREM